MNILGVDYGKKRIGLSWSSTDLDLVLAFGIASNIDELISIIKKEKIAKIVFGLPFDLGGEENEKTKQIRDIAEKIKNILSTIEIDFQNESFSTAEAKKIPGDASIDEKAAIVILRDYLKK
ncbi:MAG: Holliday junction resolvase RuvX [Patescibacteria group bacterium]